MRVQCSGNAEVGDHRVRAREQDILGLDVAMDHTVLVGVVESIGYLAGDPERHTEGKLPLALEAAAKALAFDVRHCEPELPGGSLARVVDGQYVRMLQLGGELDLAAKTLRPECRCEVGVQHLEGDAPLVLEIHGEVDSRHAATPQFALDRIRPAECPLELVLEIRRHSQLLATSRSNRGLPRSGAKLGSILSQPGDR